MVTDQDAGFRFEYRPSTVRYGHGSVDDLSAELAAVDVDRALVLSGRTVGTTDAVMEPVRKGLGERCAGIFPHTTPKKHVSTAIDAARAMADHDADGLVAVGGGSSLDVATVTRIVAARESTRAELEAELRETGTLAIPEEPLAPLVVVPTTLAGAELSQGAGITAAGDDGHEPVSGGVSDARLMPSTVVADPELYATTPVGVLTGSAMNGFDKGIESLYSRRSTPFTDGTAVRGLQLLGEGLPAIGAESGDLDALATVVRGTLLVQYGVSRPDGTMLSIIHAFGHALRDQAGLQQGIAHAILAPHVLSYLFEEVDGRRHRLAEGLGVETAGRSNEEIAEGVVDAVADVRDALGLPDSLADVDGIEQADFDAVAELVLSDAFMRNAPAELDPTTADIVGVLRNAW